MKFSIQTTLLVIFCSLILISCDKDPEDTCDTTDVTYTNAVQLILNANCATSGCHTTAAATSIGSLANYDDAVTFVSFGRIEGAINHRNDFIPMPFPAGNDKLDDCDIDKIESWIAAGTPE